jgi:hypothetical protein
MPGHEKGSAIHPEDMRNPGVSYERSDANMRTVVWFLVALAAAAIVIHLGLVGMYRHLQIREGRQEQAATPYLRGELPQTPEPRLQRDPAADWQTFHASELRKLSSYGWVDQGAGMVRIPIDRAMDLLVERGLPVQAQPTAGLVAQPAKAPALRAGQRRQQP